MGVARNLNEAFQWYRLAAEQGMPWACDSLAQMYEEGRGVAADSACALRWYTCAVDAGHMTALAGLRRLKRADAAA